MFSNFNENWYLGLFWSEELIGNDENCIQGHFYDATVSKMATNKIDKLLMVSDFNEDWYLGVFWSEELVGAHNSDMGVVWELLCLHPNTIKPSYYYYIAPILSGDVLLFYYYYITPTVVGWCIAILRFFFTIIIIILIIIILLPHIFVRSISWRCLDQTWWNLVGISYAMWSCAFKGWFFQNGCHCHGNGQNAKKMKNTKMIITGYSPNRNWWNLIGTTSTFSGTR